MYRKEAPADAHVDTADKHDSAGQKTPKEQVELCSLGLVGEHCMYGQYTVYKSQQQLSPHPPFLSISWHLIIYDDMLTVFRVVETVKSCPARVVGTIPAISGPRHNN